MATDGRFTRICQVVPMCPPDGSIIFTTWRQCALPWGHIGATWRIWLNLGLAHPSSQPKWQIERFSHFCTAHGRVSSGMPGHVLSSNNCPFAQGNWAAPSNTYFLGPTWVHNQMASRSVQPFLHRSWQSVAILHNGLPLSLLKLPLSMGNQDPHLKRDSWGPSELTTQMASRLVQLFLHRWLQSVPILYNGTPLPHQNCPFAWGSELPYNTLFPGLPESSDQTASWSVQPFLQASLVWQTNQQRA